MTHRLLTVGPGRWTSACVCTLGRQRQVLVSARRSSWESSGRRGIFRPFVDPGVLLLSLFVKLSCQSKTCVCPGHAHFPEGLYLGRPRSADNPVSKEQEIKAEERLFSEGPSSYNYSPDVLLSVTFIWTG